MLSIFISFLLTRDISTKSHGVYSKIHAHMHTYMSAKLTVSLYYK